jgi:hypothetical protein
MSAIEHLRMQFGHICRRISDALYVPSQTGSYAGGDQYLGDLASSYVENNNFPDAARVPYKGIQMNKNILAKN